MIKDRGQKATALRYVVTKRWFPQLELDVIPAVATSPSDVALTDIDLLACIPDQFEGYKRLLIDCKTRKSESPISRAFWQRGVMEQMNAQRAICILRKEKIEADHRYLAAQFNVSLMTERDFHKFALATGVPIDASYGHVGIIDLWERFFEIPRRYPLLTPAIRFSKSGYWMIQAESEASRLVIANAWDLTRELDPSKSDHLAVVGDLSALLMHALAKVVTDIFSGYLQPESRDELSNALLFLIYGGRESYEHRNALKQKLQGALDPKRDPTDLRPPQWRQFLQLVRHGLDAPTEILKAPLLLREVAWTILSNSQNFNFAQQLASESPQAAKLALLGVEYLCNAAQLPPDFADLFSSILISIQDSNLH